MITKAATQKPTTEKEQNNDVFLFFYMTLPSKIVYKITSIRPFSLIEFV